MRPAHDAARMERLRGHFLQADVIDATLVQVATPLSTALKDDGGSQRALRLLLDIATPLSLDALVTLTWPLNTLRIEAALFLPVIMEITGLDVISRTIADAIQYGAPAYNKGDARSCATSYWATAFCLVNAPATHGVTGMTRALKPLRAAIDLPMTSIGDDLRAMDDFAWRMRHALDAALATAQ
jgi:hypothetical protein